MNEGIADLAGVAVIRWRGIKRLRNESRGAGVPLITSARSRPSLQGGP